MKKFIFNILAIAIFFTAEYSHAQFNLDSLEAVANRITKKYVDTNRAGVMIGVIIKKGNMPIYERRYAYGHIRVDTTSPRPDSLTIFQLGSVTKSFSAMILSMLIQQGGPLNLNDLVEEHIPAGIVRAPFYVSPANDTTKMRIIDLATHYSALPDDPIQPIHDTTTYQMMYNYLNNHNLSRPPGQCYLYSNLGVSLLGVVLTNTLGKIIDSLFIQKICDTLNMPDTRITLTPQQMSRVAQGYVEGSTEGPFHKSSWPAFYAAGGLCTTIKDFLKYLQFQMGLSTAGMQNVLDSAHRTRRVTNDTCLNPQSPGRIGLVWQKDPLFPQDTSLYFTWKDGGTASFSSYICFAENPSQSLKTGVVVLSNHLNPSCGRLGVEILKYMNSDTDLVSVKQISSELPESFRLHQNYPNPFNPSTKIKFDIPEGKNFDGLNYSLTIYDITGKIVDKLVNQKLNSGTYEAGFNAIEFPAGIYFYTLANEEFSVTKKMIIIK